MTHILIVEDEAVIRRALRRLLEREGYSVAEAENLDGASRCCTERACDLILSDLRLPDGEGTELLERCPGTPVLIMTSYASVRSAVDAMRRGAVDYIAKPFDHDEMLLLVARTLRHRNLERENALLRSVIAQNHPADGLIGTSAPMRRVRELIERVAPTEATVLVRGESGTGKELAARAIHARSHRGDGPLIAVNCAVIPENLIESELFGHEKGAFTGAGNSREGLIEAASGGTLFLDEVGELTPAVQSRLLRVIQEGEVRRLGSASTRKVDIRLIAATHRDLEDMVRKGLFREDFYYRLKVFEIFMPPMRERREDLPELAAFLTERLCRRLNRPPLRLPEKAVEALQRHDWPGNVRELENTLERAIILTDGPEIDGTLLAPSAGPQTHGGGSNMSLDDYFRSFLLDNQASMTETELARRLGISRKALWERRQRMGIPRNRS